MIKISRNAKIAFVAVAGLLIIGWAVMQVIPGRVSMYKAVDANENGFDINYHRQLFILPKHVIIQGSRPSFHSSVLLIDNVTEGGKEYTLRWKYSDGKGVVKEALHRNGNEVIFQGETYKREPIFPAVLTWADLQYKLISLPFFKGCYYHYCSGW